MCVVCGVFFFNSFSSFLLFKNMAGVLNAGYTKYQEVTPMKRDIFHEEKAKSLTNKIHNRS